jgi:hypothetical protein
MSTPCGNLRRVETSVVVGDLQPERAISRGPTTTYLDEREARRVLGTQVDAVEDSTGTVGEPHLLQGPR